MALDIDRICVGQLETNCYLVRDRETREIIIIDPGDDASYIADCIAKRQSIPVAIFLTHGHVDHILGAWELSQIFPVPVFGNLKDQFLLDRMQSTAERFLKRRILEQPPVITHPLESESTILCGRHTFQTLFTPGHTPGGVALYETEEAVCFCGDILFAEGGMGEWQHTYGDTHALSRSIQTILALPPHTRIFPGHGDSTTVERERPFHSIGHM